MISPSPVLYRLYRWLKNRYEPRYSKDEIDATLHAYSCPDRQKDGLVLLTRKEHEIIHSLSRQ